MTRFDFDFFLLGRCFFFFKKKGQLETSARILKKNESRWVDGGLSSTQGKGGARFFFVLFFMDKTKSPKRKRKRDS